jgi:hypothetical protein
MTPDQIDHLQRLALIASPPTALVMFFGAYRLYRVRRTDRMYRGVTACFILACWLAAYLVDRTLHLVAVIGSFGLAAFYFGKLRAMNRHPEAFGFPKPERESEGKL